MNKVLKKLISYTRNIFKKRYAIAFNTKKRSKGKDGKTRYNLKFIIKDEFKKDGILTTKHTSNAMLYYHFQAYRIVFKYRKENKFKIVKIK